MKLLNTYNIKHGKYRTDWIEFPYKDQAMELWYNKKLVVCIPYFDYTPERIVPIKLNPFKK